MTARSARRATRRERTDRHGASKRYRVRYIGPAGRERSHSFPDRGRREAEGFVESDMPRGAYVDPAAGRISCAEGWLRTRSFDE